MEFASDERRVMICTPTGDSTKTAYTVSLAQMCLHTCANWPEVLVDLQLSTIASSILVHSRYQLAKRAVEAGCTHTLWIDDDMSFPPDMLLRFLQHDHPIIGINAMARRPPFRCTAQSDRKTALETTPDSHGLEKVHRTGFGVIWIATEVFRSLPEPWFSFEWVPSLGQFRGEDYGFLEAAKLAGHEVYIDHDLSRDVSHFGEFAYSPLLKPISNGGATT